MELLPQPWAFEDDWGTTVATEKAPEPEKLITPMLYGREKFPPSDEEIGNLHAPPKLRLSQLNDVVLFPKNVVVSQRTSAVLAPTFLRKRYKHHGGVSWDGEKQGYTLKSSASMAIHVRAECPLYFIDTDKPDVFGHVLLEALPRLWAAAKAEKDTYFVTSVQASRNYDKMLRQLGIPTSRILRINGPVAARQVLFPTLPVIRRSSVHPKAHVIFDKLKGLAREGDVGRYERIYISRSRVSGRDLVNEIEVEAYYRSKGFVIVHPQEHSIENQIKLFSNAKFIASVGGSAAHGAVFAGDDAKVLIISSSGWLVNADMLLSQVPGRLGYVFGDPLEDNHLRRNKSAWRVDISDVAKATKHHFLL